MADDVNPSGARSATQRSSTRSTPTCSASFAIGSQQQKTALTDTPRRQEIWLVALGSGRTGEPGKTRPAIVVSADQLSAGIPDELVVVVPVSSSAAPSALRIDIGPVAGVERPSRALCRAVRAVASSRFVRRIGTVDQATMEQVEGALAVILELDRPRGWR